MNLEAHGESVDVYFSLIKTNYTLIQINFEKFIIKANKYERIYFEL